MLSDANGPIDLTGAAVRLQIRNADGDGVAEYTDADSLTVSPADGIIELIAPYADMELPAGTYRFDIEVTLAGVRTTYEQNSLVIIEDVTHD